MLANGRPYLAIPGPSTMPDRVLAAMHRAAPNIYAGALPEMVETLWPDLRALAGTVAHVAIYIANGHGAWEAANANLFSRGDRALVLATGRFGHGWCESVQAMGVQADLLDFGKAAPVDLARFESALRADAGHKLKAVLVTHVDTASSVKNDIAAIRAVMDTVGHPALLAVDCIASMGCDAFHMDAWGVDVMVAASQKGLMVPPGLGFVWFSDKALLACANSDLRTPYWDWRPRANATEFWQYWAGTAPTHHLFGLRESLNMIAEEGRAAVWARHAALARSVWAAFDAWGAGNPDIALNVADPAHRGHSVTAARLGAPHATRLRGWLEEKAGVTLGIGLGMAAPDDPAYHGFLRVAHMGHVNAHMTLGVLATMQAGMVALGIPHGPGALDAAARVVAEAAGA
ncbi:alanine-glyoxylate transaminase / serine-glyoxylate transaminase / serine-pyruvate transaminase [Gemmobacter aquatilis]|uniref:Alanine-glyoxylate transaminase / serine-glyoxylate transaminase / serine-pyruvate transaminase n=1 Tax=Gemmobacter aquatilis TaxID=933059 RepID=A0A1H8H2Z8_9RHOB|nr:aminotransferase class V-fold PLP-dependent enzyme [Gemmobacter aquatilis]SEN50097.1 alanine-glyoxylate transaminase / serine-glyoxylate transaminase / serine-pyruvate transaminase [Gemmobacter aquatilis]